jgi:outer membrane protein
VHARAIATALSLFVAGCAAAPAFLRPEGDGGWSEERRHEEVLKLARKAGVDATPAATPAARPPTTIDLATAISMAANGNRRIAEASADVAARGERVWTARSALLPNLSGNGRYSWYSDPLTNPIPSVLAGAGGALPQRSIVIRESETGNVDGTITLPIDVSGELRHALAAAQAGYRGEKARAWATTLAERLEVVRAYFDLLEAKRLREVADQDVELYRRQLQDADARFQSGRVTKNEVLVVQVALANAEQEERRIDLSIARARYALNERIGADVNAPTEPIDVAERPSPPPIGQSLERAYEANPAVRTLVEEQQRLDETTQSLRRRRLPRLSAGAAVDWSSTGPVEPREVETGFVGFTWFYDVGVESELAAAKIAADRNRIELERQLREVESTVRTTHHSVEERLSALAAAEASVVQAEENLRIRRSQFDVGRASSEDVLDAQRLLARQRADRASALYEAHVRLAELRALMGESP